MPGMISLSMMVWPFSTIVTRRPMSVMSYACHSPAGFAAFRRGQEPVDAADAVRVQRLADVVLDLRLVAAAQVHAAVALGRVHQLDVQLEVPESLLRDEVGAGRRVREHAALDGPADALRGAPLLPPVEPGRREQLHGGAPGHGLDWRGRRCARAGPA